MTDFEHLIDGLSFTESPRWRSGHLWFRESDSRCVLGVSLDGRIETIAVDPHRPTGLGFLPDGRMLIVSAVDRLILRREGDGTLVVHADLSELTPWELNDMVVDGAGRAFVGEYGFDFSGGGATRPAKVIRADPDGSVHVLDHDFYFPNGMVITPDGKTLIVAESLGNRLTAVSLDDEGALAGARVWAEFGPFRTTTDVQVALATADVAPDGICLDASGAVWVADPVNGCVLRIAEGGTVLDEVKTPQGAYACMLGGPTGRTLFICSAPRFGERQPNSRDASILMTEVRIEHAGYP
jgi:sugar lactone lactonase YvrE